jgi:hypothetical protein
MLTSPADESTENAACASAGDASASAASTSDFRLSVALLVIVNAPEGPNGPSGGGSTAQLPILAIRVPQPKLLPVFEYWFTIHALVPDDGSIETAE